MSGLLRSAHAGFGPMNRALLADDETLQPPVAQPVKRREALVSPAPPDHRNRHRSHEFHRLG